MFLPSFRIKDSTGLVQCVGSSKMYNGRTGSGGESGNLLLYGPYIIGKRIQDTTSN